MYNTAAVLQFVVSHGVHLKRRDAVSDVSNDYHVEHMVGKSCQFAVQRHNCRDAPRDDRHQDLVDLELRQKGMKMLERA